MNGWAIFYILFIAAIVIVCCGTIAAILQTSQNHAKAMDYAQIELWREGFSIGQATMNSPAIVEITHDFTHFAYVCHEEGIMKVFKISSGFVIVTNDTYGLEYQPQYPAPVWWIW